MPIESAARLHEVVRVELPYRVVTDTQSRLQEFGQRRHEGLVLWLGEILNNVATVRSIMVPPQRAISNEEGVGYFVDGETLFHLNQLLSKQSLRLLAQVHSHPTEAYHSEMDDRYAIVTSEGGFSFVVPDFAMGPPLVSTWAAYRLIGQQWTEMSWSDLEKLVLFA